MRRPALALACLALAACQTPAEKNAAPPISTLAKQSAPAPDKLSIQPSAPVAPDAEKALENYRKLLELNPDADTGAEATKRIADLQVQVEDVNGNTGKNEALKDSIKIYSKLLKDRPDDKNNDRVLYQLARAYQNSGQTDKAIDALRRLAHDFPTSPLIADARFRAGELLYTRNRYDEAATEYRAVMDLGTQTPFFEPAQYKYAWSQFQEQKYDEDIVAFFAILDRNLPPGQLEDPEAAIQGVAPIKQDVAKQSLRVVSLSFAALGGGKAVNDYFQRHGEPRFAVLVYNELGLFMLDKRRYSDAAGAYGAFIASHPTHVDAPQFQTRVIAAYEQGGFADQVVKEKEHYADAYNPASPYWGGKSPPPEVVKDLRLHLEDLARHYQAKAQQDAPADAAAKRADFGAAAGWYRKIIEFYPQDPKLAEINLLYADSLYDGGQTREAAEQYSKSAYSYPGNAKAPEAAYAAVQAYQRLATEVDAGQRPAVLRQSADASVKLADTFPNHPQMTSVLTRAAQDLYETKDLDRATEVAARVLKITPPAAADLRIKCLAVLADSRFAQGKYAEAEAADTQLLALSGADPKQHQTVTEQLAASIYKQGEAARSSGDFLTAAKDFQRVSQVTPDASIRAKSDYDAASSYASAQDWPAAEQTLEGFRSRYPGDALNADVDKKLALAYEKDKRPAQAAAVYQRISQRPAESVDTRRDAAWLAATLYDQAQQPQVAAGAYETYVRAYPQPLDRAVQARQRLAEYARNSGGGPRYVSWLREIVAADDTAGPARSDQTKLAAAQATLELGRLAAADARALPIGLPIAKTLPVRKNATEAAVQTLNRAAAYGFAEQTTAATYELASVYHDFSKALLQSERPPRLGGDELQQYNLLLEEQAEPIDEQAIKAYEVNLERVKQGVWNPWIRKSVDALAELSPAKYGKLEQREDLYETLR